MAIVSGLGERNIGRTMQLASFLSFRRSTAQAIFKFVEMVVYLHSTTSFAAYGLVRNINKQLLAYLEIETMDTVADEAWPTGPVQESQWFTQ